MTDSAKRCAECGSTTIRFDPPIAIEPQEACGAVKSGTYSAVHPGGIPVCERPRDHEDMHAYFVEYLEQWE